MVYQLNLGTKQRRKMVPTSIPALISSTFMMENIIKEVYGLDSDQIEFIDISQENHSGIQGNLSDSGRIRVNLDLVDGSTREYYWFVKIMPENQNNAITKQFNIFRNEIDFYQKIMPQLKEFLLSEGFSAEYADFDVPEMLYAREDEDGAIIVLQDILSEGYGHQRDQNGDKFLSVEQALVSVRSIAKLHAVSVGIQEKKRLDLSSEYPTLKESGLLWAQEEMTTRLSVMKDSYCKLLQKSQELDSPTLLKRFRSTFDSDERLVELCKKRCRKTTTKKLSLQHGDFHFNNLMFKEDGKGNFKVKVVDWQLTYTGRSTGDLSYLLMSSLSHENRELYEDVIKDEYFRVYHSTLEKIAKTRLEQNPELKDREEYNDSLLLSFFLSCGNIMAGEEPDRNIQFSYDICKEAVMKEII